MNSKFLERKNIIKGKLFLWLIWSSKNYKYLEVWKSLRIFFIKALYCTVILYVMKKHLEKVNC